MTKLIDVLIPDDQKEGTELELAAWLKKVGDPVALHEPIAELTTDKAVVEIPSPAAGILREILVEPETQVEYDSVLARIEVGAVAEAPPEGPDEAPQPTETVTASEPGPASETTHRAPSLSVGGGPAPHPAVARYARWHGVDLQGLKGSGRDGRVTKADVLARLTDAPAPPAMPSPDGAAYPPVVGSSRKIRHDPMRRSIARNMRDSVLTAPHVTAVFSCDLSRVIDHRDGVKEAWAAEGIKLTFSAYFLQATVAAIREVPEVNSRWHDDGLEVFESIHVGVGTALADRGLVVPVVRDVQDMDLKATAQALTEVTEKARAGKLSPADMKGSTFTISNHGVMGSLIASPIIIHQPESAILGIGKLEKRAVVVADADGIDQIRIRPMIYVTLTIDHRVLDAFHTNRFLTKFCQILEHWPD